MSNYLHRNYERFQMNMWTRKKPLSEKHYFLRCSCPISNQWDFPGWKEGPHMSTNYVKAKDFTVLLPDLQLDLHPATGSTQRTAGQARTRLRSLRSPREHQFHLLRANVQNLRPCVFTAFKNDDEKSSTIQQLLMTRAP